VSLATVIGVLGLGFLQAGLVALPRANAFGGLAKLRSPLWVVALPAMIVLGTFGVLDLPATAFGLVVLSAVATPLLAVASVLGVVRVPRVFDRRRGALVAVGAAVAAVAVARQGWIAQLGEDAITGLGCLCIGVAIVRVTPRRWLPAGVLAMCAVDVCLLALGPGVSAYGALTDATQRFAGPSFDHATIGAVATDYPDLVLAAVLGAVLAADRPRQRRAAVLLAGLAGVYGLLVAVVDTVPATVPIALTYLLVHRSRPPEPARSRDDRDGAPDHARPPHDRVRGRPGAPRGRPAVAVRAAPRPGGAPGGPARA
jgi:hypothetical protein